MSCRLALVAILTVAPSVADAFELSETSTGAQIYVDRLSIPYDVAGSPDIARASRRAFDTWSRATGGLIRPSYGGLADAAIGEDGNSTIEHSTQWNTAYGDVDRTVAHTEVFYDVSTGVTRESDIYLNAERFRFEAGGAGAFDAESVVLHELGHLLGLAHTCGDPGRKYDSCFSVPDRPAGTRDLVLEAVMAPTLAVGVQRRRLNDDDRAAIAVHYGTQIDARVPTVERLSRVCPSDEVEVSGSDFSAGDEVRVRDDDGRDEVVAARFEAERFVLENVIETTVDIVVQDPASGAYGALVAVPVPAACPVMPPEPPTAGGCTCTAGQRRTASSAPWWLLLLIGSTVVSKMAHARGW